MARYLYVVKDMTHVLDIGEVDLTSASDDSEDAAKAAIRKENRLRDCDRVELYRLGGR